jgi:hypothetical protein
MLSKKARWISAITVIVALIIYFWCGNYPDPRFQLSRLKGVTPEEVISLCGKPDSDDRSERAGSWTPEKESALGRLTFAYEDRWRWRGFEYGIIFHNNKVDEVRIGEK